MTVTLRKEGDTVVATWGHHERRGRSCEEALRLMGAYLDEIRAGALEAVRKDAEEM